MKCKRLCLLNVSVRLARKKEGDVAIYSVDVRDGMIQRVMPQGDRSRFRETDMGKGQLCTGNKWQRRLWSCRHRLCSFCEDCSAAKRYSDY